uniref:Uncharacterized protein n=1 Tax=Oryza brachyantha TaxID=4533 RepID=J3MFF4_ORYBR
MALVCIYGLVASCFAWAVASCFAWASVELQPKLPHAWYRPCLSLMPMTAEEEGAPIKWRNNDFN